MKACSKCGVFNSNTSKFCESCGAELKDSANAAHNQTTSANGFFQPATYSKFITPNIQKTTSNTGGNTPEHRAYGDQRVGPLLQIVTVISIIFFVIAAITGVVFSVDSFILSLIIWIAGGLTAGIFYLFSSCLVYIYSNIAIIARNSDTQTALMRQAQKDTADSK